MRQHKNDYNFDKILRQFKRKMQRSGKLEEFRNKQFYKKPSTKRQEKMNAAKRRETAQQKANSLGPEPRLPVLSVTYLPPKE
jgi:small subunit ribosomal protein S21